MKLEIYALLFGIASARVLRVPENKDINQCPKDLPVSCSSSHVDNGCCTETNGIILLTQFWDWHYSPYEGREDTWTLHGLWSDHCDGSYSQFCDKSMMLHNISTSILAAGETELYNEMNEFWLDNRGHNDYFWQHEYNKHGTCYSTLKPSCRTDNGTSVNVLVDYFKKIVETYKGLPTYRFLEKEGIVPSSTRKYKFADIKRALKEEFGHEPTIHCDGGGDKIHEVWYSYNLVGPLLSGKLIPREPAARDNCKSDVYYLPKHQARRHQMGEFQEESFTISETEIELLR
ncbi:hypothetical protein E3Q23_03668 [Wallemia mellicola]|nr:hypothetical protein E3Q23_03668 [Wallemia mellicola]